MRRALVYLAVMLLIVVAWSRSADVKTPTRGFAPGDSIAPLQSVPATILSQISDSLSGVLDVDSTSVDGAMVRRAMGARADSLSTTTDSTSRRKSRISSIGSSFGKTMSEIMRSHSGRESLGSDSNDREGLSRIVRRKVDLENIVKFSAKDSLTVCDGNKAFMYGNGNVEYKDLKLNSGRIRMEMDSSLVYATGYTDSLGNLEESPVFKDRGGEYESKTMKYNFKTSRGYITDVVTQQGDGYLQGGETKKMEDGTFFVKNGKYTTCDDHEHPHFYFNLTKAKIIPNKNVVTGPAYMVLADVPLPLAVPFGYFPMGKEYSSGVLFPTFGEDYNRGFYARDGGYYFAFSDYVDLALRGEIYSRGSWGVSARSNYAKRYKFRGNIDLSYITTIAGDKGLPDYSKQHNFRIAWNHSMDPKANPNLSFSAAVNFTTSGYTRNDLNSYYNNNFTENTKSSSINLTYRIPASKWSVSATMNVTQRTQDSTLAVSFPNLTVTMAQTAPFKRKKAVGKERWYEKIRLSYSGQFQNTLTSPQDQFFKKSLIKDWRNGFRHSVPISATFTLFKYINVSPSLNINDRMYTSKIRRQWDSQASREIQDTTYGFYNIFDFNAALSFDTKIYGFWKPMKFLGDKVQMIRHVVTPTVSLSAAPDFSNPFWGGYGEYKYTDSYGQEHTQRYNHFSHGVFGGLSAGRQGIVSVAFSNNIEMKVKTDKDSTGVKKISLVENFSISQSYNFAADSMRWSNLNTSILLRLVKNFNLGINATWDPYTYQLTPSGAPIKVNRLRIQAGKGFARLSSAGTSFSYTFNNNTFKKGDAKKDIRNKKKGAQLDSDTDLGEEDDEDFAARARNRRNKNQDGGGGDADGYEKWEFPWSLSVSYSVNYGYGEFDREKLEYKGRWTQNLSFNGNVRPTKNWNFSFSASYDFQAKKIAYMNCSMSRDLHCFVMTCSFVPLGPYKSFNFHIGVKASMLKDLKWDKRSSRQNGVRWY